MCDSLCHNINTSNINFVSIATVCVNLILLLITFILNYKSFFSRRKNERLYNLDLGLYNKLVIDKIKELTDYPICFAKLFNETKILSLSDNPSVTKVRNRVEKNCDILENKFNSYSHDILPFIFCYSEEFKNNLHDLSENLYNETTDVFSKIPSQFKNKSQMIRLENTFLLLKNEYLRNVFELIRNYRPKID